MKRQRLAILQPDPTRAILRPLEIGDRKRVDRTIHRIMALDAESVKSELARLLGDFSHRHRDLPGELESRGERVAGKRIKLTAEQMQLIGACFSMEYTNEAAALFNPSMVRHPDQRGVAADEMRFVLSLRATGEGHISSIVFRSGLIDRQGKVQLQPRSPFAVLPRERTNPTFTRTEWTHKLTDFLPLVKVKRLLADLPNEFTAAAFRKQLAQTWANIFSERAEQENYAQKIDTLIRSNYAVDFAETSDLSERVLFPHAPAESRGIEDARFVEFRHAGESIYYATTTAYDGFQIQPQMLETRDFIRFHNHTLSGAAVANKGFALFPRSIDGRYFMLSRQDGENLYIMNSDSVFHWPQKELLAEPRYSWEALQIGNCGSPIETEAGWLVLTHGVGFLRTYAIGALLLDLHDPSRVIGRTREPLLRAEGDERHGYVPNVVYSCGGQIWNNQLILPYAQSDTSCRFARVAWRQVLHAMDRGE
jgi:predicted GH43/DUF377 family glycosyl hydrolase